LRRQFIAIGQFAHLANVSLNRRCSMPLLVQYTVKSGCVNSFGAIVSVIAGYRWIRSTDRLAGLLSAVRSRGPRCYLFGHVTMLDGFCKLPLAQIEQFLPSIEIGRFPRFLKIPARLALVLIGWVVRHMRLHTISVLS